MTPAPDVDALLRAAIKGKRLIRLIYKARQRIIEPHDYGVHNGSVKILTYQVGGTSSSKLPNWRWMEVDAISDIHLLNRTFPGGRPNPSGKHHQWDQLFLRVEPAEDEDEEARTQRCGRSSSSLWMG